MNDLGVPDPAGKAALLTVIAAALWKLWLRLRHDTRADKGEAREHEAKDNVFGGFEQVIEQLRDEVERLGTTVKSMSVELAEEREARIAAEATAQDLRHRVGVLERRLRDLGHTP